MFIFFNFLCNMLIVVLYKNKLIRWVYFVLRGKDNINVFILNINFRIKIFIIFIFRKNIVDKY